MLQIQSALEESCFPDVEKTRARGNEAKSRSGAKRFVKTRERKKDSQRRGFAFPPLAAKAVKEWAGSA